MQTLIPIHVVLLVVGLSACSSTRTNLATPKSPSAEAAQPGDIEALRALILKTLEIQTNDNLDVTMMREDNGTVVVTYRFELGDGGYIACRSRYRTTLQLAQMECTAEYYSHSMGSDNSHFKVTSLRTFNEVGEVSSVSGRYWKKNLASGEVREDFEVTQANYTESEIQDWIPAPMLTLPTQKPENPCAHVGTLESELDHAAKGYRSIPVTRREGEVDSDGAPISGKLLSEGLVFPDGMKVTYVVGGCAHYSYSFKYVGVRDKHDATDTRHYMKTASDLLARTPVQEGKTAASILADLLDTCLGHWDTCAEKAGAQDYVLRCSPDIICDVTVKRTDASTVTLTASYDFPL